jgi:hypothetical protein
MAQSMPNLARPGLAQHQGIGDIPRAKSIAVASIASTHRPPVWRRVELEPLCNVFYLFSFVAIATYVFVDIANANSTVHPLDQCTVDRYDDQSRMFYCIVRMCMCGWF